MKIFFLLFALFFFQAVNAQADNGGGIQILRIPDKNNHLIHPNDTAYLSSAPADKLSFEDITIKDSSITMPAAINALVTDSGLQYKFYFTKLATLINDDPKLVKKQQAFFAQISTGTLYINNNKFSGVLKLFLPFQNIIGGRYNGYNMVMYTFKEGEMTSVVQVPDVDPNEDGGTMTRDSFG
jgi:hypothetical protein